MARAQTTPTSVERPFEVDELFFSTTDPKGIIRSGNAVFARVSGYAEEELLGEAHNLVRHPDMPRAVFQLLWEYLERREPVAAYVKNLAKDGSFYWVIATVVAIDDGAGADGLTVDGYLSIRMKPTSELLPAVEALYTELRAVERDIEGRGGTPREAMAASRARLELRLGELGFAGYGEFMRVALPTEFRAREQRLRRSPDGARVSRGAGGSTPCSPQATACSNICSLASRASIAIQSSAGRSSMDLGSCASSPRTSACSH